MTVQTRNKAQNQAGKTFEKIRLIVKQIPPGKVATYGQIAALTRSGLPARIVGYALHTLPDESGIPWHRVINSKGLISYSAARNDHDSLQRLLLEKESIEFSKDGKVNLKKYIWNP